MDVHCSYSQGMVNKMQYKWDQVFKNGPSIICVRQPLKNLTHFSPVSHFYTP